MTDAGVADDVHAPAPGADADHPGSPDRLPTTVVDTDAIIDDIEAARHPRDKTDALADVTNAGDALRLLERHDWPQDTIPGFGEPDPQCGDYIPEALQFCTDNLHVHQNRHVCYQYDCPQHAPAAVRRRVAGTTGASGIAPQLDALARYLGSYTGDRYIPYHLILVPDEDYLHADDDPRDAGKNLVKQILDELGLQGVVFEHLYRGDHEDPEEDDLGNWKHRLPPYHGDPRNWEGDVRNELEHRPHYHAVVMAPDYVDYTWTEQLEAETGWTAKYLPISQSNDDYDRLLAMSKVLAYAGSHASVYDAGDQRRLAAWYTGPDLQDIVPTDESRTAWIRAIVDDAAEDALGITSSDSTCHKPVRNEVDLTNTSDELPDVDLDTSILDDAWQPDDIAHGPTLGQSNGLPTGTTDTPPDAVAGMASAPTTLTDTSDDDADALDAAPTTPTSHSATDTPTNDDDAGTHTCGGGLRHISQAGEYLVDAADAGGRIPDDHPAANLDRAYKSYVRYMEADDRDPLDPDEPTIPELEDAPPPD